MTLLESRTAATPAGPPPASEPTAPPRRTPGRAIRPGEASEALAFASSTLLVVAVLALWFVVQLLFLSGLSQARSQHLLYAELREQLASATAPIGPVVPVGHPVALLSITKLGLQEVVVEGTASGDLQAGPGHRRDTVLPGQQGVSLVYGRAGTYGAPFAALSTLRRGDELSTQTAQGHTTYTVTGVRRAGDPLPAPPTAGEARLTLVTSEGSGALGSLTPATSVYVDAVSTKAFPAPGGVPATVPASEQAMAGDPSALPLLTVALAMLLGLAAAVTWSRRRWSASLIWVIASPVALALAWFTTDLVVRLLPNLS